MKKLKRLHVIIIGVVLLIAAASASFFLLLKPQSEEIAKKDKEYQEKKGIADTVPQKEKDLAQAKKDVITAKVKLVSYSTRFRKLHFEKASGDWDALFDLWHEYREQLGPAFIKFVASTGCRLTSGITMPTPPLAPISPPATGFLAVPESGSLNVTVSGTVNQVFNLLKRLPSFEYLNAIGPVSLSGTSPLLTASFPITFYIVVETSEKAKIAAPAAVGGAPGGGPGGPGGPAPGGPGGPPAGGAGAPPGGGPPVGGKAGKAGP